MIKKLRFPLIWLLGIANLPAAEPTDGEKLFALHVQPLFAEKCMACHGAKGKKIKGGFDMRTRESVLLGGDEYDDEVLTLGKGGESYLYLLTTRTIEDYEMPPKEADKLSEKESWTIRDWITAGAPWPDENRVTEIQQQYAEGEQVSTSKALDESWQNRRYETEKLWAYRPLKQTAVPTGKNPIDHFVDAQLAKIDLTPAPAATAHELARRLHFGLTGLPPSPKQAAQFESQFRADQQAAVTSLADQLMASPHYGEHFGRHWLDVVRYADSAGFANDYSRPHAWRYRDYVIRSFNQDKSFPTFVREQLAGDELAPGNTDSLIATGFLRMGPWEQTAMSVFKETRQFWLDDVVDSVGQTFLAHPLQCAKCHDHKFDPIPTRDYYRMMAVFSSTQFADHQVPFSKNENLSKFEASQKIVTSKIGHYQRQSAELQQAMASRKKQENATARVGDNGLDPGDEASNARMAKNIRRHTIESDRTKPRAHGVYTGKTIQRHSISGHIPKPAKPWTKGTLEKDHILTGGSAYSLGAPVVPGAISAAESLGQMATTEFPAAQGNRRLALANWIIDPKNPLTARVIVNRVWSWHFSKGLAGNPNNFGGTGALPTHPELLDHLAHWFTQHGSSIKKLNALIISSAAYQRSSRHPDTKSQTLADPGNKLYATFLPRRLTAEEIRDAMLIASGEMNPEIGGLPAKPDINWEVATQPLQIMGGTASIYEPDPFPAQRNRRSIYAEKLRGLRDPFFETFNQPGTDNSCENRETSTVAPQALTLLNAQEMQDRSLAFAHRLLIEKSDGTQVIHRAFQLALGRPPTSTETSAFLIEWKNATDKEAQQTPQLKSFPTTLQRTIRAEKTGELYTFTEHLPVFETYQPDLQPADADPRTRALSHLCLVLFNSNEFSYLD